MPDQDEEMAASGEAGAAVIPLRKSAGISGEPELENVTDDLTWQYHQKRRGRENRKYSGRVTHVHGAEGERIRNELSLAVVDLLRWAQSSHGSLDDSVADEEAA